jgi:hypothetical protein
MATWDSPDLLSRVKLLAKLPSTDTSMTDANWYSFLTEAQSLWYSNFVSQAPWWLMGAPTLLTSADSGVTYTFGAGVYPLAVELYETLDGRLMKPCSYADRSGDYVWEGDNIRFPGNDAKTFSDGPYARWVAPPGAIAAATEPTLQPAHARILLVYRAVALWAATGNLRDPGVFFALEKSAWMGRPEVGDIGILGLLKTQNPFLGASAYASDWSGSLLQSVSTGSGYRAI